MNRQQIRDYVRILADELTETPEGLFYNTDLNSLINIAQQYAYMKLIQRIPWYFRKAKLIGVTANKETYSMATDLSLTDFFLWEMILKNDGSSRPAPLLEIRPDDRWQFMETGATKGLIKAWGYEDKDSIFFTPPPSATEADKFKGYYFKIIPDLNHDTSDVSPNVATPHLPAIAHTLISYEVIILWHIRGEEEGTDIRSLYMEKIEEVVSNLSLRSSLTLGQLPSVKEML